MAITDVSDDSRDLAEFGYKQELTRTLGSFSTFATGFAFISILTGMFLLFAFAYTNGGPASIWSWIIAAAGQFLFALAFAELATRYPLAGSVYNWTKNVGGTTVSWMAGVAMILALIVSTAAVGLAFQAILPSLSSVFWIYGDGSGELDASINGVILGSISIMLATVISLCGTRIRGLVNNIGVTVELVGVAAMIILLAFNIKRGPGVVFETNGTELAYDSGFLGALLVCMLVGLTVMWGFDTAGSVGEETIDPRRACPTGILRALLCSGVFGALLFLLAFMSIEDLNDPQITGGGGLSYVIKSAVGEPIGNILLVCAAVAVFVAVLANQTGAVNMIFAMSRDNALPGSGRLSTVSPRSHTPVVAPILQAALAIAVLLALMFQPQILIVATSVTATLALVGYTLVVGSFAMARMRGKWVAPQGYFTLGKAGLPVSILAVVWGVAMIINLAWPRQLFYNPVEPFRWYLQWGGVLFPGTALLLCFLVYRFVQRKKIGILESHSAGASAAPAPSDREGDLGASPVAGARTDGPA